MDPNPVSELFYGGHTYYAVGRLCVFDKAEEFISIPCRAKEHNEKNKSLHDMQAVSPLYQEVCLPLM